ncbi:DUF481 domain-containing protein [Parasphingopyxis marina]|uniref:DUF481 domain-containing protein n=1 Tax=Parasphingopyxis marina TaxID=2761622 RepID=A0A842HVE9_9SPHN|nr:DUF481 domain-containing protein [Parasphingopyxis marina]MBC2777998.1 DUF481 domain-containing protein [Parasphingopyxis marina]
MQYLIRSAALVAALAAAQSVHAALPEPVRAMIDAAFEDGDAAAIDTVIALAKRTNPGDEAEIDALLAAYTADREAVRTQELREQSVFEGWSGEGEIGFSQSTGNSDSTNVAIGIALDREGLRWRHAFRARADFQRSGGQTTREQFLVSLEPQYKFDDRLFAYGLAQYERDRFQGYSARYTLSGGLGYRVIDAENMTLDLRAGPAWRQSEFTGGGTDSSLAALASLDYRWEIADGFALRERASVLVESGDTTLTSETGLEAQLIGALSARLSYVVQHETSPPFGREGTDTLTRATLVYGF